MLPTCLSVRAIKRGICFGTNSNGSSSNRLVRCTYDSFGNQHQEPYSDAAQERATIYPLSLEGEGWGEGVAKNG